MGLMDLSRPGSEEQRGPAKVRGRVAMTRLLVFVDVFAVRHQNCVHTHVHVIVHDLLFQ